MKLLIPVLLMGTMLTITPVTPTLSPGDSEARLSLSAAADAAIGDFTAIVTGRPAKGQSTATELNVAVDKN